jgi:hypothetical protein
MEKREPGFFYGLGFLDFVRIALAFLFSLSGFYLGWRTLFGPPLFGSAVQSYVTSIHAHQPPAAVQTEQASPRPAIETTPGEISVGIAPLPQRKSQSDPARPAPTTGRH